MRVSIIGILAFVFALTGCSVAEDVALNINGGVSTGDVKKARDSGNEPPDLGLDEKVPLVVCTSGSNFFTLLSGDANEDSVGRSFMVNPVMHPSWRYPILASANSNKLQIFSSRSWVNWSPHAKTDVVRSTIDLRTGTVQEEVAVESEFPKTSVEVESVLGEEPRRHAVVGGFLVVSGNSDATVYPLDVTKKSEDNGKDEEKRVKWPAASGPYWNVRSLGDGWIAWDRLRTGSQTIVAESLGKVREDGSLDVFEIPYAAVPDMHQIGIVKIAEDRFLWLEWRSDWATVMVWSPTEGKMERFPIEGKISPTFALLKSDGKEEAVFTDGEKFQFLSKIGDNYEVTKRIAPRQNHIGRFNLAPGTFFLNGVGTRLYAYGKMKDGNWRTMAVEETRFRAMSTSNCRDPHFSLLPKIESIFE